MGATVELLRPSNQRPKLAFSRRGCSMGLPRHGHEDHEGAKQAELAEEARKLRRLQIMMSMVMSVLSQDSNMTLEEASEMAADARRAALAMFPGKELAYDLIYRPRLQRIMNERFRLQ
jgi:hypothetical protein